MEITLDKIDSLNAILKVNIVQEDYKFAVEKSLHKLRKNVDYKGFRKGMVPKELIKRKYGASVLVDELEKIIHDKLFNYIKENELNILGEPLPCETKQQTIDFETQVDFEFYYDIALTPKIEYSINKEEILPYYTVKVSEEMIDKKIKSYQLDYGYHQSAEEFVENDFLKGILTEWENDSPKDDGLVIKDATVITSLFKNEEEKVKFNPAKKGNSILFNPAKAYDNNPSGIASVLGINEEEAQKHLGDFLYEVKEIIRFHEAEINQELFDTVFPNEGVTIEADFREKIKAVLTDEYLLGSENKFLADFRQSVEKKIGEVQFPDAFLKRWMHVSRQGRDDLAPVETVYSDAIKGLKFQLVKRQLIKEHNIDVEADEVRQYLRNEARVFFVRYGMTKISDKELDAYVDEMIKKEDTMQDATNKALDIKLCKFIQKQIKLDHQEVSPEEFSELIQ
jgi:trigger factor